MWFLYSDLHVFIGRIGSPIVVDTLLEELLFVHGISFRMLLQFKGRSGPLEGLIFDSVFIFGVFTHAKHQKSILIFELFKVKNGYWIVKVRIVVQFGL